MLFLLFQYVVCKTFFAVKTMWSPWTQIAFDMKPAQTPSYHKPWWSAIVVVGTASKSIWNFQLCGSQLWLLSVCCTFLLTSNYIWINNIFKNILKWESCKLEFCRNVQYMMAWGGLLSLCIQYLTATEMIHNFHLQCLIWQWGSCIIVAQQRDFIN